MSSHQIVFYHKNEFNSFVKNNVFYYEISKFACGEYLAIYTDEYLCSLSFLSENNKEELMQSELCYFENGRRIFDCSRNSKIFVGENCFEINTNGYKLALFATDFQKKVWQALLAIPQGTTLSYKALARNIGLSSATRAVANAIGKNKIAFFIPCHRIIRTNSKLGGYRWGLDMKRKLLEYEKAVYVLQ